MPTYPLNPEFFRAVVDALRFAALCCNSSDAFDMFAALDSEPVAPGLAPLILAGCGGSLKEIVGL